MREFNKKDLQKLYIPDKNSSGEDNGQVTIIGGSSLFHGAPLLSLKAASRVVDMVFFASPEESVGIVAQQLKSKLLSYIWVPWDDVEDYIAKSDAVLIGPGFMRFSSEKTDSGLRHSECDNACQQTREITRRLLEKYPNKKWVIDAGSLQTMDADWIPKGAIITPNKKEFEMLFGNETGISQDAIGKTLNNSRRANDVLRIAKLHNCIIVLKGPETIVCSPEETVIVKGGNAGLTKGGTGDVLAGLTVALLAKNDPLLTAASASLIAKYAADELYKKVGTNYNADDLVQHIPQTLSKLLQ